MIRSISKNRRHPIVRSMYHDDEQYVIKLLEKILAQLIIISSKEHNHARKEEVNGKEGTSSAVP